MPRCDASAKGRDCAFDEATFTIVFAVLWILTALPLLAWAMPCLRKQWSASRLARASLLLAAASAVCSCADQILHLKAGRLAGIEQTYGNMTLWGVGSIFLVFAICVFSCVWCDVASALAKLHAPERQSARIISIVRFTYKLMAALHVPFAALLSMHDYEFMRASFQEGWYMVWGAWLLFGTCVVLSGLAAAQYYIARFHLGDLDGARSLQEIALINLVEQVFFDIFFVVYVTLYQSDNSESGSNIAAYHSVGFLTYWAMHVQVVLFFAILGPTDPLYSQGDLDSLMERAERNAKDMEVPPTTMGSPVSNAA